jgi:DnaJ like chaperone protein
VTPAEWAAIGVGLVGGYWLVNAYLTGGERRPPDSEPGAETEHERSAPEEPAARDLPWYEVLGVGVFATREEVAAAYKRKISEYHPDKVAQMGDEIREVAERKSKQINAAYEEAMRRFG